MTCPDLITKKELDDFLKAQKHICELIEEKTKELAMIQYGRLPEGEICEFDIEESPFEKGCIFIEFEIYSCGASCLDQYNLPFEFLYNEKFPVHYKYLYEEKKRKLSEQKEMMKQEDEEREQRELDDYDRRKYKRLKIKFGDD